MKRLLLITGGLMMAAIVGLTLSPKVSAEYVEHNIIADSYYLDAASMSVQDIQNFLNGRGGALANYYSYSDRDGRDVSAATIIYEAGQDYGISPKVLLATLQKEQSLVTARNPTQSQYNFAMGYGCPDSAACQAKYVGLFKQVDNAAWQFRFNYERARGNNTWWRTGLSYPCGGQTRYYNTGLYPGRYVTFYDDNGTAIKGFTINNPSTASLYCYTPHPYNNPNGLYGNPQFGSTGQYYSGSYNFVRFYESWFGNTQPSLTMASSLMVTGLPQGVYSGVPTKATFDMYNSTAAPITVNVAVTVRDGSNTNQDFALKPITVPPWGWATYTDTKTFAAEGTYSFGITSFVNGQWSDTYPLSASIDNPRTRSIAIRNAPTVTATPAASSSDLRVGKATPVTFTVRNNSAQAMDLGRMALAMRTPSNTNADLPLKATGSIAPGATYSYTNNFTPTTQGTYTGFITYTGDNGTTWDDRYFPVASSGVSRSASFAVKPNPTLTAGPTLSVAQPRVGQQVTTSFKVRNFGDTAANVGYVGLAIRDPFNRSVDAGGREITVDANGEYTFQATKTFTTPGTYTAWITSYKNGIWDDLYYPAAEDGAVTRKVTFTVLPSPTLTAGPTLSVAQPRVGQQVTTSFKVRNFGDTAVNAGYIGIAIRDPNNRGIDAGAVAVNVAANGEYTFQADKTFTTPGIYTAWITSYKDGVWDDVNYPVKESDAVTRKVTFTVLPNPTISASVTSNPASPRAGQPFSLSFKVKNYTSNAVNLGYLGLVGRDQANRNVDPGSVPVSLAPNEEETITLNATVNAAGQVKYYIVATKDFNIFEGGPTADSGSVSKSLDLTVVP